MLMTESQRVTVMLREEQVQVLDNVQDNTPDFINISRSETLRTLLDAGIATLQGNPELFDPEDVTDLQLLAQALDGIDVSPDDD